MRECQCPVPEEKLDRNNQRVCIRCGFVLADRWLSSTEKLDEFFDQIELWGDNPALDALRYQCHAREQAGRSTFKLDYLGRDNTIWGDEEAADGANYSYFETLKNRRAGLPEIDDIDLYHAAHAFAQAYLHLARYRQRQLGH